MKIAPSHEEFISDKSGEKYGLSIGREEARFICMATDMMPKKYSWCIKMLGNLGCMMPFIGLALFFFQPWWVVIGILFGMGIFHVFILTPTVNKSSVDFVVTHAENDPEFYERMVEERVFMFSNPYGDRPDERPEPPPLP